MIMTRYVVGQAESGRNAGVRKNFELEVTRSPFQGAHLDIA